MQHIENFGLGQFQNLQIILRQTTKSSPQPLLFRPPHLKSTSPHGRCMGTMRANVGSTSHMSGWRILRICLCLRLEDPIFTQWLGNGFLYLIPWYPSKSIYFNKQNISGYHVMSKENPRLLSTITTVVVSPVSLDIQWSKTLMSS